MSDSNIRTCCVCQKPNANLQCVKCTDPLCKSCAQFSNAEDFSLTDVKADKLPVGVFCGNCYNSDVAPALDEYNEIAERARDIFVYYKAQAKENRFIRRKEKPIKVKAVEDRDENLLRLAFIAAKAGFNCIVDVDITSEKIIVGGYQKSSWSAVGVPVNADLDRIRAQNKVSE